MKEGRLTTRCGTPSYCAPELLSGAGYGKAVDVWSLGVLAYVVLTGVLPFVGADRAELFRKIQKGSYDFASVRVPISALARDLIWRLLRLVTRALGELWWADFQRDSEEDPDTGEDIGAPQIYEMVPSIDSIRAKAYEYLGKFNEAFPAKAMRARSL